eukprot:PITA_36473
MLEAGIIEPIEDSDWMSPMVVEDKKQKGEISICIDLQKLNDECVHDTFPTPFTDDVLDNGGGLEAYSFIGAFLSYQIALNLKKCIFCVPFVILLGHVVCKQGLMVDPSNIVVTMKLEAPRNIKELHEILRHTRYYKKFIEAYAQITTPIEKLLKKDVTFCWDKEC